MPKFFQRSRRSIAVHARSRSWVVAHSRMVVGRCAGLRFVVPVRGLTRRSTGPAGHVCCVWPTSPAAGRLACFVRPHMKRAMRSHFLAMRASARFGRATKLRDSGKMDEARRAALDALAILAHPHVVRSNPAEASVVSCATILAEELANQLHAPGASCRDLADTLDFIRTAGPQSEFWHWREYLEHKVAQGSTSAA